MNQDVALALIERKTKCANRKHRNTLRTPKGNCQTCLTISVELAANHRDPDTGLRR